MIITFCGHSSFIGTVEIKDKMMNILEEKVGNNPAEFLLGGYGDFDSFAYSCCKEYQKAHPQVKLIFVTPYITESYQRNHLEDKNNFYDEIIYPEIEKAPLKFAISYRNKWMVEKSDLVIAYVKNTYGGAYQTYKHAQRKEKEIINLV